MDLTKLEINDSAVITGVRGEGALRQHLLDMGVIPGAVIKTVKYAPMGDPVEYMIHGYELTLRLAEAANIDIKPISMEGFEDGWGDEVKPGTLHPGYGEGGVFHDRKKENPLPDNELLTFALVGNQNSGKTTLFNALTGSRQHVGNFPGVTVDRKDGMIKGHPNTMITDLPGIYSMSPYSSEELVSRNFVLDEKPKGIINIVDATNIERNLYLTMQLLEMNIPMVVALNMMDVVYSNGTTIDVNKLEEILGVPVVPISAQKGEGIEELVAHAIHVAHYQERPPKRDFCDENENGGAVHRGIHAVRHLIGDHAEREGLPLAFCAVKVIEGDRLIIDRLKLDENEKKTVEHIIVQMERERGLDRSTAIAQMRFSFIETVAKYTVRKSAGSKQRKRSEKIDRIVTGKYTAIPTFIIAMGLVFYLSFNLIGAWLQGLLEMLIGNLSTHVDALLTSMKVNDLLHGLVIKGIFEGVGSVLSFIPIIITLFFFLSLMEDSGYIARVAFVMDKLLRKIGLSGRSIVPLLVGFGCTVPAVMATRTLPSERDRKMTILLTPFMSCTAKLPIYGFFVSAFFPGKGAPIMIGLYLFGIISGIIVSLVYDRTLFKGEPVPFVMELPDYRLPSARNVMMLLWEKAKDFIQRAFSVILIATIAVWFLQTFDIRFNVVADAKDSILAGISSLLVPLMRPLGLGDWRICTSLISGFLAKESVVATMQVMFGKSLSAALDTAAALGLLVFSLIYTPCVAAVASIRRELGDAWAASVVVFQCVLAWLLALLVRLVFLLIV